MTSRMAPGNWAQKLAIALCLHVSPGWATESANRAAATIVANELWAIARSHNVPALGLVIVDDGKPIVSSVEGAGAQTPFRLGSITKSFTALTLLTLQAELDKPLADVIPRTTLETFYRNPYPESVRLRDLLALSAGFADLGRAEFDSNAGRPDAPEGATPRNRLAHHGRSRATAWPPGLHHSYTNYAPALTAQAIETLGGAPFPVLLRTNVLDRLGMDDSTLEPHSNLPGGFQTDGRTEIPYWHMSYPSFGALNAPVNDVARFITMLANHSAVGHRPVFPNAMVAPMFRPNARLLDIGYGAGMYGRVVDGHVVHGHGGDADGYRSRFGILPEARRGYFVVINTDNPRLLRRLSSRLDRHLVRGLPQRPSPKAAEIDLAGLAGTYYPSSVRFGLGSWREGRRARAEITVDDGLVTFVRKDRTVELIPIDAHRFRRKGDPGATIAFVERKGRLFFHGVLGNWGRLPAHCQTAKSPWPQGFLDRCLYE